MTSTTPLTHAPDAAQAWHLPDRGIVGMACLILAESAIFVIFVVAYIFYIGKSLSGPTPRQVLELPIFNTVCLLSSSVTIHFASGALYRSSLRLFQLWLALTVILGSIFLAGTGTEWYHLIYHDGLTIHTNLFGTTFYSLVGLHAAHVIAGLAMLTLTLLFALMGRVTVAHHIRFEVLSLYWHFVDSVWIIVFLVVYVLGK